MAADEGSSDFRSVTGQAESTEPTHVSPTSSRRPSAAARPQPTVSSTPATVIPPPLRKASSSSLAPLASPAAGQSPRTSRNTSPVRKDKPSGLLLSSTNPPSAAAIQRALSASSVPQLPQAQPVSESGSKLPQKQKDVPRSGDNTPQWPASPRLRSPPPSTPSSRRGSGVSIAKKPESSIAPSKTAPSASSHTTASSASKPVEADAKPTQPQGAKPTTRAPTGKPALETVQETSSDTLVHPPPPVAQASTDLKPLTPIDEDQSQLSKRAGGDNDKQQPTESGSESAGNKSDGAPKQRGRRQSGTQPSHLAPRQSRPNVNSGFSLSSTKSRPAEGKQNMTVETETVPSIPQSGLTAGERSTGPRNDSGSVRLRPSNETIRPKKERKKNERKARSINQGSATSKADLFEARVASAVDEANTSDSDETFVYESNPPEPQRRQRHHSRTPSVTSSHSIAEQSRSAIRPFGDTYDERRVGGKRSMKFSSNNAYDDDSPASNNGTIRAHTPRHIGRFGRGSHHSANYDQDSPYTQTAKTRHGHLTGRSTPNSPRSPQTMQYRSSNGVFGRKQEQPYDFDAEQNADDETAPLLTSIRGPRGHRGVRRISVRPPSGDFTSRPGQTCARLGACVLTAIVVVMVLISAIGFIFASSRPLYDVQIKEIEHVLASEQELMLDLLVTAVNPNTMGVMVSEMDLDIFARSKHIQLYGHLHNNEYAERIDRPVRRSTLSQQKVNSEDFGNPSPSQDLSGHWHTPPAPSSGGHDHGTDPPKDPGMEEPEKQTLFLGRAFHFDQALYFESSPLSREAQPSVGALRINKPGNKTETDGSEKWEKVVQFPFELVVKGVLTYQLPLMGRSVNVGVSASIMVHPEDGVDEEGNMRVEKVDHSEEWQWVDWEDLKDEKTRAMG